MSRIVSAPFFSARPVFDRAEYAAAVGRRSNNKVVTAMLAQHLRAGNIKRIARGVFASVPKHADSDNWSVDRSLAASRLRHGGVIAYHSAMELHGCAYTEGHEVQVISPGEPGVFETTDFSCRFVKPPRGLTQKNGSLANGITLVDRMGLDVLVTTIERTIADLFDRYDLAGGAEELFNSLDLVARVDAAALVQHARARQCDGGRCLGILAGARTGPARCRKCGTKKAARACPSTNAIRLGHQTGRRPDG